MAPPSSLPPLDVSAPPPGRIGVLLINLGTPDAPTRQAVRRYLGEFLSDPRVVEIPAVVWQPLLRGVILNTRPAKSAHAYQQVWTDEGSPLAAITAAQARDLQQRLGPDVAVDWAMRYGAPAIAPGLVRMTEAGCDRILIAPLYPQYSGATTASAIDAVAAALRGMRRQPAIRTLPAYFADRAHIDALTADIARQLAALDFDPETLLISFHGMPERTARLGDPYYRQCLETARLLGEAVATSHPDLRVETSFQSRFGKAKWLEPSTDAAITRLAAAGVTRLAVVAPGFSADCLETREELALRGRDQFFAAGGARFAALDCLNASAAGMAMLEALVRRELAGWI